MVLCKFLSYPECRLQAGRNRVNCMLNKKGRGGWTQCNSLKSLLFTAIWAAQSYVVLKWPQLYPSCRSEKLLEFSSLEGDICPPFPSKAPAWASWVYKTWEDMVLGSTQKFWDKEETVTTDPSPFLRNYIVTRFLSPALLEVCIHVT